LRVEFRPTARLDVLDAERWYEGRVRGLGAEFGRAVDAAVAALTRFPEGYPRVYREVRKAVLRRFPYSLLYTVEEERIIVHACFHHRRDPRERPAAD